MGTWVSSAFEGEGREKDLLRMAIQEFREKIDYDLDVAVPAELSFGDIVNGIVEVSPNLSPDGSELNADTDRHLKGMTLPLVMAADTDCHWKGMTLTLMMDNTTTDDGG